MLRIIKRCRKATVYDDNKNLLCQASVFLDEEEHIMLSMPYDFDEKVQETFEIIFFDPVMGLIPCRCALSEPEEVENKLVIFKCEVLQKGAQIQRRQDIKVPVDIDIAMVTDGVVGGQIEMVDGGYAGKLTDISAGGTFIESRAWVEKGYEIGFTFSETKTPIYLTAEVLRVVEQTDEEGNVTYGHGCIFRNLSKGIETQLRTFVYKCEREMYKNDIW